MMAMLSRLRSVCDRWRHSRGFGVHSPFAFRLVTEAIRPPRRYAYYAELEPGMTPLERTGYRIGIFLRNAGYPVILRVNPATTPAGRDRRATQLLGWIEAPDKPLLLLSPRPDELALVGRTLAATGHGLLLESPRFLLAVPRPEMAHQHYTIL